MPAKAKDLQKVAENTWHRRNEFRTGGDHLLDLQLKNATIAIDYTEQLFLVLPQRPDFLPAELEGGKESNLMEALRLRYSSGDDEAGGNPSHDHQDNCCR